MLSCIISLSRMISISAKITTARHTTTVKFHLLTNLFQCMNNHIQVRGGTKYSCTLQVNGCSCSKTKIHLLSLNEKSWILSSVTTQMNTKPQYVIRSEEISVIFTSAFFLSILKMATLNKIFQQTGTRWPIYPQILF